ncbi:transcriptional regulator [Aggregatibacter actinomycetemcomitans serotype b str. SCC4092]|uniref:helix-turn-helix domain-containing protein n=1 Tax=Aggregatibacter actinomycetemcomitans TaxID=714 RepID=UPI00022AC531|nr:helix-turn-helix transcriptional regulator [Aggregatibacter actinomycetemcomitans]KND83648.1 transcriptional regulator [Aggregatibacter actinomycetemcomitans serotype b str. SCC1398]KOE52867.1 transcriptional regulator [Aggregatibacter actinomycetemcomitans serotype b str. SCC4092]
MKTLQQVIDERSVESLQRIQTMAEDLILETGLQLLREELNISQQQLATILGVTQPAINQLEQRGNEIKLATLKRYIEAMGGKLRLSVEMPDGHQRVFQI